MKLSELASFAGKALSLALGRPVPNISPLDY